MNERAIRPGQRVRFTDAWLATLYPGGPIQAVPGEVLQIDTVSRGIVALVRFEGGAEPSWCRPVNLELLEEGT